ncbi:MAG: hypothetical protein AB7G93_09390 [Bdellovibrionales bacterium]
MTVKKQKGGKPVKLITLREAVEISNGYFSTVRSLRNLVCKGKLHRYGPPKQIEIDYYEFMEYLGRPA